MVKVNPCTDAFARNELAESANCNVLAFMEMTALNFNPETSAGSSKGGAIQKCD